MEYSYYDRYIGKDTVGKYDVTPIFLNSKVFSNLVEDLIRPFNNNKIDKIVGIEALGFIIGGAVSNRLGKGFVPVRRKGKIASKKSNIIRLSTKDYSEDKITLEMLKKSIRKNERVLIVDDWVETGAQINAAIKLIGQMGGKIEGISVLFAERNEKTEDLFLKYNLKAIKTVY